MTYSEKLRDPRWQKKRLEVLSAASWRCEDCRCPGKTLEVHHCSYMRNLEPWQYDNSLLMALCEGCHERRQSVEDAIRVNLGKILRLMAPAQLEDEAWRLVDEMATRWTAHYAEAFA